MASHSDIQKIRIIGGFFENRLHWQFEAEKKFLQTAIWYYIFIYLQIKYYSGDDLHRSPLVRTLENFLSNMGTPSAVNIYSMYLCLNLSATPDWKF
jgi:hypothetical protein